MIKCTGGAVTPLTVGMIDNRKHLSLPCTCSRGTYQQLRQPLMLHLQLHPQQRQQRRLQMIHLLQMPSLPRRMLEEAFCSRRHHPVHLRRRTKGLKLSHMLAADWYTAGCAETPRCARLAACARCQSEAGQVNDSHHGTEQQLDSDCKDQAAGCIDQTN